MKRSRLIIELSAALFFLGVVCWQQRTIDSLRRTGADPAAPKALHTSVSSPSEPVRRKAEAAPSRPSDRKEASGTTPDVATLKAELTALREQNKALASRQERRIYTSEIMAANGGLNDLLITAEEVSTRPADTTGLRPDGEVAAWSARQVIGAPDTPEAGDLVTAWASRSPDAGEEWLQLSYGKPVDIAQINVHETYNPGAVSRITALLPDGSEKTLWEGTEPREEAPVEVGFPVPPGVRSDQIKVYVDTARVPGWNEIDAVELVGRDGSRQWATASSASSYYGDRR